MVARPQEKAADQLGLIRASANFYGELFRLGYCHTTEVWDGDQLVGGLYGVALGGAFFGESMFSRARDASKIALVHLVARLVAGGFALLDTQFVTDHLRQFGTIEVDRDAFHRELETAIHLDADFSALHVKTSATQVIDIIDAANHN